MGESKTQNLPVTKKNALVFPAFLVKLYPYSKVTIQEQKPKTDEVGQVFRHIK